MNNEIIKDIALQCINEDSRILDINKFSELLLNTCVDVVAKVESPDASTTFDFAQHQASMLQAKLAIKNYFSLEWTK